MKMKVQYFTAVALLLLIAAACGPMRQDGNGEPEKKEVPIVYTADLNSLNQGITNQPASGSLTITVRGDSATIELSVSSLAPGMMHLAHLHGYKDGSEASCPPVPEADKNDDGIVDLIETRDYSGITMIPFHDDPVSLEIKTETYPVADERGNFSYSKVVSVKELSAAVKNKFGIEDFSFDKFVLYVHGVSEEIALPGSVESLPDVPAMVTLPVACGELGVSL